MGDTLSPFIPGTQVQFAYDSTSLGWAKTCARYYKYSMIDGWRTRAESVHLIFGQHYHKAMERYAKLRAEGASSEEAIHQVVYLALADSFGWESDHKYKNRQTLIRSIVWYLDQFADDSAETWQLSNGKPAVELSFKIELDYGPIDGQPYLLCGHLDRIAEYQGALYVSDHKTTSSYIGPEWFDQFAPDNQMSLYTLASQVIFGAPVKGVIIDGAQLQVNATKFARGLTYRTERQLEEWLDDTRYWIGLIKSWADNEYWPMNDKSCHHYGGCPFREVCSKDPAVREVWLKGGFVKKHWNPLESR